MQTLAEYNKKYLSLALEQEDELRHATIYIHDGVNKYFLTIEELYQLHEILNEHSQEITDILEG